MGDHVVLDVDKLVEPKSVECTSALGPVNVVSGGKEAGAKSDAEEEAQPLLQMAECRICQEEDSVSNLEMPCACSGSLKVCLSLSLACLLFSTSLPLYLAYLQNGWWVLIWNSPTHFFCQNRLLSLYNFKVPESIGVWILIKVSSLLVNSLYHVTC